ncbi:MAG: MBL fold metallo-hydrolase [Candidatus Eisenbacteria bacterium]
MLKAGSYEIRWAVAARFRMRAQGGWAGRGGVAGPAGGEAGPAGGEAGPAGGEAGGIDRAGRTPTVARVAVIRDGEAAGAGAIVVDAGPGTASGAAEREAWGIEEASSLPEALAWAGIAPDSVARLVLTHLHGDHAGGAAGLSGVPIVVSRANLERARGKAGRDGYRLGDLEALERAGPRLQVLDGPGEIAPGIEAWQSDGHAAGLLGIRVRQEGRVVLFPSDLLPTLSHLRLPGSGEYDEDPARLEAERRAVVEEALREDAWIFLYHDPRYAAVRLGGTPERPIVRQAIRSSAASGAGEAPRTGRGIEHGDHDQEDGRPAEIRAPQPKGTR